jgi:UDP-glucose 4-epimerase
MRALVVGGNGFIGSHLVDRLARLGWEVVVFDLRDRAYDLPPAGTRVIQGDLDRDFLLREALAGVDVVFHLAWTTIHQTSNEDPEVDIQSNLIPSVRLMEASRRQGVARVVFLSSGGTVYGPAKTLPIPETHRTEPISAYGITKLAVEKYLALYRHLHGLDYVVLRPSVPYGPRQNPLGKQGAVSVFLYRVAHGLPITIWGDGSASRDYFYISDLVDAIVASGLAELGESRTFNVGGGQDITLKALIESVERTLGKKAHIDFRPPRAFDAPRIVLDTRQAEQHLGWSPVVPLAEGLELTWRWMAAGLGAPSWQARSQA